MALTPVEIRHVTLRRALARGYRSRDVDDLLADVVTSFEDVWRERADLRDKLEALEADLVRFRELEALLRTTLVSAERASHEMKAQAKREAELIVGEAHAEARRVTRRATAERERLERDAIRVRALLRSALEVVGGDDEEETGEVSEAA